MHGKWEVIAPAMQAHTGLLVQSNSEIDTDALGTFTGEIARENDMLQTAIRKARLGMDASRCEFGVASEGSFGPHPDVPFLSINRELIVFVDDRNGIVIHEMVVSENTNFCSKVVTPDDDISDFIEHARFPEHALVVSAGTIEHRLPIFKGIRGAAELQSSIKRCAKASADGRVLLQTDMRANFNPLRMSVIGRCAEKLAARIGTLCPRCTAPGWGIVDIERGLPCEFCGGATNLIKSEICGCVRCDYRKLQKRGDKITHADQMFCPFCNP